MIAYYNNEQKRQRLRHLVLKNVNVRIKLMEFSRTHDLSKVPNITHFLIRKS